MPVPSFVSALGNANNPSLPCTPGAELWVTPGGAQSLSIWFNGGFCPAAGVVYVGSGSLANGATIQGHIAGTLGGTVWAGSTAFQDTRPSPASPSSPGASGGLAGELTLTPFEYTEAQQAEMYSTMTLIFGAFLGALALVWALKSVTRIFNWHGNQGD